MPETATRSARQADFFSCRDAHDVCQTAMQKCIKEHMKYTHDIALRNTKGGLAIQVPRRRVTATSRNSSRTGHVDSREPDLSHQSGARLNSIISEWMGVKAHWNQAMTGPLDVSFRSVFATRYSSIDAVGGMMYASARTRTTRTTAPMMSRFLS